MSMTEYYTAIKRNGNTCHNMENKQKHAKWKKPNANYYKVYDFIYMKCQKKTFTEHRKQIVVVGKALTINGLQGILRGEAMF